MKSHVRSMARVLVQVNQKIREAEAVTVSICDADTLNRATKVLAQLKEQRRFILYRMREK